MQVVAREMAYGSGLHAVEKRFRNSQLPSYFLKYGTNISD